MIKQSSMFHSEADRIASMGNNYSYEDRRAQILALCEKVYEEALDNFLAATVRVTRKRP